MEHNYFHLNIGSIHCCRWMPKGTPVGIVQIIHGINEYVERYHDFADYLADHGFLVIGEDHPGHGLSVDDEITRGYMTGGWIETVKLIHKIYKKTSAEYPGVPYVMFGHSMGSFLLMTYLSVFHDDLSAAVISGTGWQPAALLSAGRAMCAAEASRLGEEKHSPLLQKMMFGSYNSRIPTAQTPYDWISTDLSVVKEYASDPLCTWRPSIQLCSQMLLGIQRNQRPVNLEKMKKDLPVFFISGQQDPVGNYGKGVLKMVRAFQNAGMKDVLVELYPDMRHECHNEIGKDRVYQDILQWILQKI